VVVGSDKNVLLESLALDIAQLLCAGAHDIVRGGDIGSWLPKQKKTKVSSDFTNGFGRFDLRPRATTSLGYTHFSPLSCLPCSTCRWYSIEDRSADFMSVLSTLVLARWVLVERSARGCTCVVVASIVEVCE